MSEFHNNYHTLRQQCLEASTRRFNARGKSVRRCDQCQLADYACICRWRPQLTTHAEFVLIMHRNELFKPTNTGRLIADVFPTQTQVFKWSRTQPPESLLTLLADQQRDCRIVFPREDAQNDVSEHPINSGKINTFILLDGTWKQARRMMQLSHWLKNIPVIAFPESLIRGYSVRKSEHLHQLSTAEAAGLCLQLASESKSAETLFDYFSVFNTHYLATRGCYKPVLTEAHKRLEGRVG